MNYSIVPTHISEIRHGDTVEHHGEIKTVSRINLKKGFMGRTLYGDCYRLGTDLVRKVVIAAAAKPSGE